MSRIIDFKNTLSDRALCVYLDSSITFYSSGGSYYCSFNESGSDAFFIGDSFSDINSFLEDLYE